MKPRCRRATDRSRRPHGVPLGGNGRRLHRGHATNDPRPAHRFFRGSCEEHNWAVPDARWRDYRAQMSGEGFLQAERAEDGIGTLKAEVKPQLLVSHQPAEIPDGGAAWPGSCAPHRSLRSSDRDPPHPEPALPGDFLDQAPRLHPGQIALHGGAASFGQSLGHRRGNQRPFGQHNAQGDRRSA